MMSQTRSDPLALTETEYSDILAEIEEQPEWRATADKEADYADGNQLDTEYMRRIKTLGIPPAVDDLIGPALRSLAGYEVNQRADWRVTPDGQLDGQDVADALSFRLNQAERQSKADRAMTDAFRPQAACGLGWVEVAREPDPFKYPYRAKYVHRNQIHWDMRATEPDLSDARWLRRQLWMRPERIARAFPDKSALIESVGNYGAGGWLGGSAAYDGGQSTGLQNAWDTGRAWTRDEALWYDSTSKEICLAEVWYRRWVNIPVMKLRGGRAVEYDADNLAHAVALASGGATVAKAIVSRVRQAYWIGPHLLSDRPSPYQHQHFPYVPFWGFREDMTGIAYGLVRGMKYAQDSLNSGTSKLRWGMATARLEYTKGATAMPAAMLAKEVARVDSMIELDAAHMAQPGARFEVKRDYQLSEQHFRLLDDNRASIDRVSAISASFQGRMSNATSGAQESMQIEQSNQSIASLMDSFRAGRAQVGELLLSLIVEDMGQEEQSVVIEGDAITADRTVVINKPEVDESGQPYLSNDLQRLRLKVSLDDVPSTLSYRAQQLNAMSETTKSLPPQYQAATMPFLASLLAVPFKRELVEALRAAGQTEDPKAVELRVRAEVTNELKARELELRAAKNEAEIKEIMARAVQIGVQSAFSAMQSGAQVAMMPAITEIADGIMQSAGYQPPNPAGVDPNFPIPGSSVPGQQAMLAPPVRQNTSPTFPPVPSDGGSPMTGIETKDTGDNLNERHDVG